MLLQVVLFSIPLSIIFLPLQPHSTVSASRLFFSVIATMSSDSPIASVNSNDSQYEIMEERLAYSRWRTIVQRRVRSPKGHIIDFDVIGQRIHDSTAPIEVHGAVLALAYHTETKSFTLIREYNPGSHCILYGPAAGMLESGSKHNNSNPLVAAQMELEEECHLAGGTWYRLVDEVNERTSRYFPLGGVFVGKYENTEMVPYLVVDPVLVSNPRPLDATEDIEIVRHVTLEELRRMLTSGQMTVVGSWTALLALDKLRQLGEID